MKFHFLLFTSLLTLSPSLHAFTLGSGTQNSLKGFDAKELNVYLNTSNCPSTITSDLQAAIDLWNTAPTSGLFLKYGGESSSSATTALSFSEKLLVGCSTDFNTDAGGCDATCLAFVVGRATFSFANNQIVKGVVILNENNGVGGEFRTKSTAIRQVILAHELGHALGLGHSENEAALMHYTATGKEDLRLHQDDVNGISYLYPRNEFGDNLPLGCGLVTSIYKNKPKPPQSWLGSIAVLLFIPVLLSLLLRRRPRRSLVRA